MIRDVTSRAHPSSSFAVCMAFRNLIFFLMFGQQPRIPIDFLLGGLPDPVSGEVHEWIQGHQSRLQMAFDGAQK